MRNFNFKPSTTLLVLMASCALFLLPACVDDEMMFEPTRLFQPVLNEQLMAELNTIIVNMGNSREAISYTVEVSRDSFMTVLHTIETDSNYLVIDEETLDGEELRYGTLYQVRATARAADPAFNSLVSDLGEVRTERFPSILRPLTAADVLDVQARVSWAIAGLPVTYIRVFTLADELLENELAEFELPMMAQDSGLFIIDGLQPSTEYQVAIYSGDDGEILRGWTPFTTTASAIDLNDPRVIDLSQSMDPDAVINAIPTADDGQIIVLKKGFRYNLPSDPLDKSVTITSAAGFGSEKATLYTTGNWNFVPGAMINHVKFIDIELRGEDFGGDYVFNPNLDVATVVDTLMFDDCIITNFRGVARIRTQMFLRNFIINNSVVDSIGNYGVFTTDTDGVGMAAVDNITLTNSTFSKMEVFLVSRQNSQSVVIDNCTFNEWANPDGVGFRWRGEEGLLSNVINGISITNSIFGAAWDPAEGGNVAIRVLYAGLESTSFNIINTYATSDFSFTPGSEISGFPALQYNGTAEDLWVAPFDQNFNFEDTGFSGARDAGDPRWRLE